MDDADRGKMIDEVFGTYGPHPDYLAMLEAERKAEETLMELAPLLAEGCASIWRKGDGYGGYVMGVILNEFQKRGCGLEPYRPGPSKNRRKIDHKVRTMVLERDEYRCVKCKSFKKLCVDHIHPYSLGGSDDPDNLQTLCWTCNSKKGAKIEVVE